MGVNENYQERFNRLKCCVIIPTYNNAGTLERVIAEVKLFTNNIIVVNDGSTDNTSEILNTFENIGIINIPGNSGKGHALKTGFGKAIEQGYSYAVTIDSDGQHNSDDMLLFLDELEKHPGSFIIGARDFNQKNLSRGSGFANRFSNFWFRFFTNYKLNDTQSGYRLYPLEMVKNIRLFSGKYEYEFELLVKAAWKNAEIISVPIQVYYPESKNRISHFRPFRDFARISLLNTLLFFIAVFYMKPLRFFKNLNRRTIREFFKNEILASNDSNGKIVFSVMLGIFMGVVPIWGYQLIAAIALAYLFKLKKVIVVVVANISIVPMIPVILYLSYVTGGLVIGTSSHSINNISDITFDFVKDNLVQYIVGSFIFALILSLAFGISVYLLLKIFRRRR